MTRDSEADIRKINNLRQRVKAAENATAVARVHYQQAQEDLEAAKTATRDLGINPDDQRGFEYWLDKEAAEIEELIVRAEANLGHIQEAVDGR